MVSPRPSVATRLPCDFWKHVTVRACHDMSWLPGMCPSSGYSNLLCTGKLHKKVTACYDKWMDRLASPTAFLCRGRKGQDLLAAYLFMLPCMWISYESYILRIYDHLILKHFSFARCPPCCLASRGEDSNFTAKVIRINAWFWMVSILLLHFQNDTGLHKDRCNLGCNAMLIYEQLWAIYSLACQKKG